MEIEVFCDENATTPDNEGISLADPCMPKVLYKSKHGCPVFTATAWVVYVSEHPWILAVILIVLGAITAFRGRKFFNVLIGVISGLLTFIVSMLIFSAFGMVDYLDPFSKDGSIGVTIVAFLLAIVLAVIVGLLIFKFAALVGLLVLAITVGFFLGITAYNTLFNWANNGWVMLGCGLLGAIILGILARKFHDSIMILGTSFLGAYAFIRGWSLFFGKFPNEYVMFEQM